MTRHWPPDNGYADNLIPKRRSDGKFVPDDGLMVTMMLRHESVGLGEIKRNELEFHKDARSFSRRFAHRICIAFTQDEIAASGNAD